MPAYSGNSYGTYQVTIPALSTNVRFSVGGAAGGGSASSTWNHGRGGNGRSGDFRLKTRNSTYVLTFYLGEAGGKGNGPALSGRGAGGRSPIAGGGNGHRSGGGGGGASGVYDSGLNRYVVIVGGGGGAGRYDQNTGISGMYTAGRGIGGGGTTGGFSGRGGQSAGGGHRGGGGGGSNVGGAGSLGGAQTSNGYAGIGGNSAWYNNTNYYEWTSNSGYANPGNGFFTCTFEYAPPVIQYFNITPQQFVLGDSANLEYKVTGYVNSVGIDVIGQNLPQEDDFPITPQNDTSYTLSASGPGGNASLTRVVDVLIPPSVVLGTQASDNTIILGQSTYVSWTILGDVAIAIMDNGVGEVNISGGQPGIQVSPSVTTTYKLTASHPIAGTGSDEITITVIQPPDVDLNGPSNVNYGDSITMLCESQNATQSLQLLAKYNYLDETYTDYEIVKEFDITGTDVIDQDFIHQVTYNNFGPYSVDYKLYAIGQGGLTSESYFTVDVDIDQRPDSFDLPESDDKIRDEQPIITPDAELTSQKILINDIDIPVKIKADSPIQVEIDDSGTYVDVEQI
ncbi:virion structural protein [Synechococcus phage S-CAM3]|uniref:Structural protein n=1 Tax=Synechococcus phage S-CAM3 TaxID=1883366 RepID=A0A1D8KK47_9CAUD|nr:virion structural protein [Synechococcus phage S-CAM3]AOV58530.1 structural protein [Synechococcus phage S-CAM3]AOV59008.1 structural protein [Synechococcus phage S-CAM3]